MPENKLDFSYFKGRAEFGDEHGGGGGLYGRPEDIVRSDTPGQQSMFGSENGSRPGTPLGGMMGRSQQRAFTPAPTLPVSYDASGDISQGHHTGGGFYQHRSGSTAGLMGAAAEMPVATPGYSNSREQSPGPAAGGRAPGFLGGGPMGYGGLPQHEHEEGETSYDYFRARRTGTGMGQGGQGGDGRERGEYRAFSP